LKVKDNFSNHTNFSPRDINGLQRKYKLRIPASCPSGAAMKQVGVWAMNGLVVGLFACIPFGIGMAFYMDDSRWLWFCAPILIFLS
jgi:hypothetical protein